MKKKLTGILFFCVLYSNGQKCDCLKSVLLLEQKIETNQASYQHQVIENNRINEYQLFRNKINKKAKSIYIKSACIGLISIYLNFFRDAHSFIFYKDNYVPEANYLNPSATSKLKKPKKSFEGLWYFKDGSFSINVISKNTQLGEWLGVIENGYNQKWKKGQIKVEFFSEKTGALKCVYWSQNLVPKVYRVNISDSIMSIGRAIIFYRNKPLISKLPINNDDRFIFKPLSVKTNYLKIPSFDLIFSGKIDSLITSNLKPISSKNNLIIDIRDNGGGGFDAFKPILPFVLDNPVVESPYYGSVWVSKDNFDYYDSSKYEYAITKQDSINELKYVEFLKQHFGKFALIETMYDTIKLVDNYPAKIGLIFNRNTASSAEGFILLSKNSSKVKTYGENSAGVISYGDWMPYALPELNIFVAITTKKSIFRNNEDIEYIGISPDMDLTKNNENDWINIALKDLEK